MKLKQIRETSGKTQMQVAEAAKVSLQMYQRYEYGWNAPKAQTAIRIARALNSTVEELFG